MKFALSLIMCFFTSLSLYSHFSSDTFISEMRIREGLVLRCDVDMIFPDRVAKKNYTDPLSSNSGQQYAGFDSGQNAICTVEGEDGAEFRVLFIGGPWQMTHTILPDTIQVDSFELLGISSPYTGIELTGGSRQLEIVGTIDSISAGKEPGLYVNPAIAVEVQYE